jgi:hypothetical protein
VYSTLQPELVKEQARREEIDPAFVKQHPKEHLQHELKQDGGFAWGIRKAIFGSANDNEKK